MMPAVVPARRRGIVAFVALVIAPIATRADDLPAIRVLPPQCAAAPLSIDDFVDSLRVELAGRQPHCCAVGPGADGVTDAVRVTLSIEPCDAATEQVGVAVEVTDPPRTVERQVSLADLPPEARSRALALAVAELIRSAGGPAQPEAAPATMPQAHPPGTPSRFAVAGSVAGQLQNYPSRDTTLWGARLGISLSSSRWQVTVDGGAAASRTAVSQGEVSILEGSVGLFAGPRFVLGPVIASAGPTVTLGGARIAGQSSLPGVTPDHGWGIVSTAGVRAAAEGPAGGVIRPCGYVEGGYTVSGLDAKVDGQHVAGISGPYFMLAIGVKFGPG